MLLASNGLKNLMLSIFPATFNGGAIFIYSGSQPATAHSAPSGTLLAVVSNNGLPYTLGSPTNGLQFAATNGGFVVPHPSQRWVLTGLANGNAGWARLVTTADDLSDIPMLPRVDCAVNPPGGAELILANTTITTGVQRDVDYWLYGIPPF